MRRPGSMASHAELMTPKTRIKQFFWQVPTFTVFCTQLLFCPSHPMERRVTGNLQQNFAKL